MKTTSVGGRLVEIVDYSARPHQRQLAEDIENWETTKTGPQFFVNIWHRRAGKSLAHVERLIRSACNPKTVGQYYYLYPAQKKIREHIWENPGILPKLLPTSMVSKKDEQRMVIHFKTGSQLIFDGTDENPDKHRGGDGKAYVLDEMDDQKKIIFDEIIRPIVEFNKGWVAITGTPKGVLNLHEFYQAGQDPSRTQWVSSIMPATVSKNYDGSRLFTDEQLAAIQKDMVAQGIGDAFRQEYLCEFISGANQVFRKIEQVVLDEFGNKLLVQDPDPLKRYRIGVDPAITSDYWVNSVMDMHTHHEVFIERFQPMDSSLGEARTEALCRKWNMGELVIDSSGIGKPIADHMQARGLPMVYLPTGIVKQRLITNLSMLIDKLTVRFLPEPVAMAEMRDYTFERIQFGSGYRFSAPEGKHDDTVIARALVCWELPAPIPDPVTKWNPFERPQPTNASGRPINTFYGSNRRNHDA
jgi:hypothetical protein